MIDLVLIITDLFLSESLFFRSASSPATFGSRGVLSPVRPAQFFLLLLTPYLFLFFFSLDIDFV